jgi:hypothetical protein
MMTNEIGAWAWVLAAVSGSAFMAACAHTEPEGQRVSTGHASPAPRPKASATPQPEFTLLDGSLTPPTGQDEPGLVVQGPLPPVVVRRILALHDPKLRSCLRSTPAAMATLEFTITSAGTAANLTLRPTLPPDVVECLRTASANFRFPEVDSPVSVIYELDAQPDGAP